MTPALTFLSGVAAGCLLLGRPREALGALAAALLVAALNLAARMWR